ncbi:MAG: glycosyltransferase [Acidimicrobiia bacterium]
MSLPLARLDHLAALCDDTGLLEHAQLSTPRRDCGYTTDDNGRMLVVLARADQTRIDGVEVTARVERLCRIGLSYLQHAALADGDGFRNRMSYDRRWLDDRGSDDSNGRALWGLGTLAARTPQPDLAESAHRLFWSKYRFRSPHPRAVIYAILGATELAEVDPSPELRHQIRSWVEQLPAVGHNLADLNGWRWPEPRMTYDNARFPEAMISAGAVLGDSSLVDDGMGLLRWLIETETAGSHFSFTPVGGRGPGGFGPRFDQQPIEAWAMIDASAVAASVDGKEWEEYEGRARDWFTGANDLGETMIDSGSGGGFDGLTVRGPNRNQGAESTLAALAALSYAKAGRRR